MAGARLARNTAIFAGHDMITRKINVTAGDRFSNLVLVSQDVDARKWVCKCDCGKTVSVWLSHIKSGHTRSCGCLATATLIERSFVHGHTSGNKFSGEYHSWSSMLTRCLNSRSNAYKYYGGRGITVCERWRVFENFLADMGPRPSGFSLDRINVNENYEPSNCRWATASMQSKNRRTKGAERRKLILNLLNLNPMTLTELYSEFKLHPECVKKEVRKLVAEGSVKTFSVPSGTAKGKTLMCEKVPLLDTELS